MSFEKFLKEAEKRIVDLKRLQELGLVCKNADFFPSVHYPPITMYPPHDEKTLFKNYQNPKDNRFDVYAHLPFCEKHCVFCHYPVKLGDQHKEKDRYLKAMEKEMDIYTNRLGIQIIQPRSILVGGGTPTYLSPEQLEHFLKFFTSRIDMKQCTQFNYDVDPKTLIDADGRKRLELMKSYGVTRLTIGVQAFNDQILQKMNRHHTAEEAIRSIETAQELGFKVNIEFIYGYPGDTPQNWYQTIEKAISLNPDEIQLYRLKVIPYGDFQGSIEKQFNAKPEEFLSAETTIMMKQIARSLLEENGYNENLGRVFSKKREDYSHYADNQCCKLYDEIGFGLTAFSSLRDRFILNTQNFDEYYQKIEKGELPINRGLVRSDDDQMRWAIILPLKNREIYKKLYEMQTGKSLDKIFRAKIETLKKHGLITETEKMLKLTPMGRFFADEVSEQFHHPNYIPFPKEAYNQGELYPYSNQELNT